MKYSTPFENKAKEKKGIEVSLFLSSEGTWVDSTTVRNDLTHASLVCRNYVKNSMDLIYCYNPSKIGVGTLYLGKWNES